MVSELRTRHTENSIKTPFEAPGRRPAIHSAGIHLRRNRSPLTGTIDYMKSLQRADGYWWFTLEANESIGAEFIFLMHYLESVDEKLLKGIAERILDVQRPDGTWAIYNDGPADLSTTVECYFALKLAGYLADDQELAKAREYVLKSGGIEKTRVFTKIHLAMFGLVPWTAAPAMPAEFILMPKWFPVTIYEFSSWARATIVPLLVFMSVRQIRRLPDDMHLDELFAAKSANRDYSFKTNKGFFSLERFLITIDRWLKYYERHVFKKLRKYAISKCYKWIIDHIKETEDIYPALAYSALALKALGETADSPGIRKSFEALKMFQQDYATSALPALPDEVRDDGKSPPSQLRESGIDPAIRREPVPPGTPSAKPWRTGGRAIHQQCCISPVWDTPWMVMALLEAGVSPDDPKLIHSGRWLISKQIRVRRGDWAVKNPSAEPGGWSFEFENSYFPDVDDTIEVLHVLHKLKIPWAEKMKACRLGLDWLLSMQNDDGGWGAFDKNQTQNLVNRIPFSDHGACLDPSSPDITGRMIEFLVSRNFSPDHPALDRAIAYIKRTQEPFGGWFARWGVNYIYGTWCALTGLAAVGCNARDPQFAKAVTWLESVQRADGGYGESPESYLKKEFVEWKRSTASQTAWALMGLIAGGAANSKAAVDAANFLLNSRNENGSWGEEDHTGTGFPGHFYIRYHGYRHYFPLLALAKYRGQARQT